MSETLNGGIPPLRKPNPPHTVRQPSSTEHTVVQLPVTESADATLIALGTPAAPPPESSTRTTKEKPPAPDGVPARVPPEDRCRPDGKDPLPIDQLYGGVPPAAVTVTGA